MGFVFIKLTVWQYMKQADGHKHKCYEWGSMFKDKGRTEEFISPGVDIEGPGRKGQIESQKDRPFKM